MDIGSISSMYLNNVKDQTSKSADLADRLKNGTEGKSDQELMEACKEFEAYFTEQVFKNMRKAMVPQSEEDSGAMSTLKNYFEDELWKNYSSQAADQSNNGLAQMLYEQMKRNRDTQLPKEPDEPAVEAVSSKAVSEEE